MYKKVNRKKQGYCVICQRSLFEDESIKNLINPNKLMCSNCKNNFKEINESETILGVKVKYLFEYNHFLQNLIYQYKGCYDMALKDVFLFKHKKEIRKKYKGYFVIFPPSNVSEDRKRGFNHIEKLVECLRFKSDYMFYKEKEVKQTTLKYKDRQLIGKIIKLKRNKSIDSVTKYLIIDDIVTTKATIKSIIKILLDKGVSKDNICAIIIAKKTDFVEL